jgi:hypothetical protein
VVINDNEEFFSAFEDSRDEDYRESSEGGVSDNKEGGDLSVVKVDESNNRDSEEGYIRVGEEGRGRATTDNKSSDGSSSVIEDDKEEVAIIEARRVRKRKVPPTLEDRRGVGINSNVDTY